MLGTAQANNNISINLAANSDYQKVTLANLAFAGHITPGKISVEGQLYIPDTQPKPGECILAHYVMRCCAADLSPVSATLLYPPGFQPKSRQWVRVRGVAARRMDSSVVIKADMIEPIGEPSPPYLY